MEQWTSQMHPVVPIEQMRAALTSFYTVAQRRRPPNKPWSGRAADAVYTALGRADIQMRLSAVARCHAFRNMTRKQFPRALDKWLVPDESGKLVLHDILIDAVALAPLRHDGKFRIKEFAATVEKLTSSGV